MQVFLVLLMFFASIFGFGLRDLWQYPLWIPIVFSALATLSLFTPYMRGARCLSASSIYV